ncbi:MAG: hypothetical protein CMO80_03020 [Verrucomicrobiales bacterium]|nr:hypothetical protein [Verrucomicrobiales bacterium]
MDGNAYRYGPTAKVPEHPAAWDEWEELKQSRSELLNQVKPELQSKLIARAKLTTSWKSSDWRLTKAVGLTAKPTDQAFKPGLGLPNAGEALPRKSDQARWFECKIFTPIRQDLWLSFTSGPGFEVILDGKPIEAASRNLPLTLASGDHTLRIKLIGTPDRLPVEVKLENAWKSLAESKAWPKNDDADRLLIIADPNAPSVPKKLATRSQEIASRISTIETEFTTTLVAKDLPTPRETKILERGEYHLRIGDPLKPGVLAALGLSDSDAPMNRLGLARWLTDSNQPLVSRVLINRIWQRVFGYGLVRTPEEFGRQGDFPTHPALLDWLAVELQQSGWNLKHMLRLMLNSRTFKQISATRREIDDPENRLFARGPRQRLDAEVIRDIGLWASDLLDPHMGGEGVKPYQPAGMWKALTHPASNTVNYKADTGNRVYRRSLYVYWKRTSPHPMMTLFDAPSREASCVQRSQSNTPVQSLGLFNERQRLEMARALALKLLRIDGDQNRLDHLFNLLACREPNDAERRACKQLLETMRKRYQADPDATQEYVFANVDGKPGYPARLDEIAAWSQVTGMVLASDVAILLY